MHRISETPTLNIRQWISATHLHFPNFRDHIALTNCKTNANGHSLIPEHNVLNVNLSFFKTLHAVIDDYMSAKEHVYKCILFSPLCPIPTYFCILRFSHEVLSAGLVLSMIAGMTKLAFFQIISKLLRNMLY